MASKKKETSYPDSEDDLSDLSESESDSDDLESSSEEEEEQRPADAKKTEVAKKSTKEVANQPFDEALELSESFSSEAKGKEKKPNTSKTQLKNQPFDEALELSTSPDKQQLQQKPSKQSTAIISTTTTTAAAAGIKNKPFDEQIDLSSDESEMGSKASSPVKQSKPPTKQPSADTKTSQPKAKAKPTPQAKQKAESSSEESDTDEDEDDSDNAGTGGADTATRTPVAVPGAYSERDFAHLNVSQEIKELFQYIGRFKSQDIELETRLKCFIPEFIPAVGDMDSFLKVPRPDGKPDDLGLKILDEPSVHQSDATVLDLQLRAISKKKHGDLVVRSIENAEKSPKEIDRWITSIADLHRSKPPPQVHYTKSMPDIESLMQLWPEEFEELLGKMELPSVDMDFTLEQYIRVICAMLDIPVYKNVSESLHVLFTLYLEFGSNQHFTNYQQPNENPAPEDSMSIRK